MGKDKETTENKADEGQGAFINSDEEIRKRSDLEEPDEGDPTAPADQQGADE